MIHEAKITINTEKIVGIINPNLYGHFAEHLGECIYGGIWVGLDSSIPNKNGIRTDIVDALKKINIPILRWPGGCFADDYHWRDGIGSKNKRPIRINRWWNDRENNHFGTHEFMELCNQLECEAYICGNIGSGTVREMSDWLEYLNCSEDTTLTRLRKKNGSSASFDVRVWGVGNENWGCGGGMTPQEYANEFRKYSTYLSSYNSDKPLYKIACGANNFNFNWTEKFFQRITGQDTGSGSALSKVQGYAIHYYCGTTGNSSTDFNANDWYALILKALCMEELIEEHRKIMDKFDPQRKVDLICDEWGTWHPVMEGTNPKWLRQQNTMRDAVIAALNLDIFNRNADKIAMANIAQTINVLQSLILTKDSDMVLTPTYHVYNMYKVHQGLQSLDIIIDTPEITELQLPAVSGSASLSDDEINLTLVNIDIKNNTLVNIDVKNNYNYEILSWEELRSDEINDHNTFAEQKKVIPKLNSIKNQDILLKPASINLIKIKISKSSLNLTKKKTTKKSSKAKKSIKKKSTTKSSSSKTNKKKTSKKSPKTSNSKKNTKISQLRSKWGKYREDIQIGMEVIVAERGGKVHRGKVAEILTNAPEHEYGIKVKLKSGIIGRIQEIKKL